MLKYLTMLLLLAVPAFGASGDAASPSACSAGADWSNCDSTYASDDNRATNAGSSDHSMTDSLYGFSVPGGATIDSFYCIIEGNGASALSPRRRITIQPILNGSATGDAPTHDLNQTTDQVDTVRGVTNGLWNTSPTVSDINDNGTGWLITKISGKTDAIYVDHVQMVVWYTEAGEAAGQVIIIGQ